MRYFLGIDHGTKGYVCLLDSETNAVEFGKIPRQRGRLSTRVLHLEKDYKAADYDVCGIHGLVGLAKERSQGDLIAVIEDTLGGHARTNANALHDLYRSRGLWEASCDLHEVRLYRVSPMTWKSKLKVARKSDEEIIELAKSFAPSVEFQSLDAVDAFLIAIYASWHWQTWHK